jgi:hypothetical protein
MAVAVAAPMAVAVAAPMAVAVAVCGTKMTAVTRSFQRCHCHAATATPRATATAAISATLALIMLLQRPRDAPLLAMEIVLVGLILAANGKIGPGKMRFSSENERFSEENDRFSTENGSFATENDRFSTENDRFSTENGGFKAFRRRNRLKFGEIGSESAQNTSEMPKNGSKTPQIAPKSAKNAEKAVKNAPKSADWLYLQLFVASRAALGHFGRTQSAFFFGVFDRKMTVFGVFLIGKWLFLRCF